MTGSNHVIALRLHDTEPLLSMMGASKYLCNLYQIECHPYGVYYISYIGWSLHNFVLNMAGQGSCGRQSIDLTKRSRLPASMEEERHPHPLA
jgi:hypothetical protein